MSASSRPTLWPPVASPSARLTAVVDLPTPPLPLATAIMCLMPGSICGAPGPGPGCAPSEPPCTPCAACGGGVEPVPRSAVSTTVAEVTPTRSNTASSASRRNGSRPAPLSGSTSMAKATLPSLVCKPLTIPALTMSLPLSGSFTSARALNICSSVTPAILENSK